MTRILPRELEPVFTSDWDGLFDGADLDRRRLEAAGYRTFPWRIDSSNPWWSRPLKLGEIGCTLSHLACWQHADATGAEHVLILEDDVVLSPAFPTGLLTSLRELDGRRFDLLYLGRYPLGPDKPARPGLVSPGYSHCTFAYLLRRSALRPLLDARLDQAIVPVDEFLPSLCIDHPRADLRARFPPQLTALAVAPPLVRQLPKQIAGSDTEDSAFLGP
jgi:collagen beta-1,O-galactosyltransferase